MGNKIAVHNERLKIEKERHFRRSIVYEIFNFSCFNTDVLYYIFAYLGKLAYQGSFVSSK
ncbi:TPA: hypothetical protein KN164_001942 [Clostridioides difficile]|uniref:hypothetical protein n=1 Tax=Clostridioides difficile TaxID=1496 RepID=UPI001C1B83BD|nr:hypothetical protein [Clostridioides difficile]MDY6606964.1 hypothetical protein [Clostridioides difficile]MDY6643898.1 hypothetical protein [Clostridioides difficile]HBF2505865.1 hypothetical protein [Clostridioides difficile]HBF5933065.1 hypothetical protein [Clostridioides difficile]HBF6070845.1 hypothetical protein [Clostridioides difficile]